MSLYKTILQLLNICEYWILADTAATSHPIESCLNVEIDFEVGVKTGNCPKFSVQLV